MELGFEHNHFTISLRFLCNNVNTHLEFSDS